MIDKIQVLKIEYYANVAGVGRCIFLDVREFGKGQIYIKI